MGLTEKQYKHILSKLSEQSEAEPVSATPEAGTSSTQAGGTGYPEVGKWESGVTRGPANQVGVTKWSDVVGSKLTRSKANQLKEQMASIYAGSNLEKPKGPTKITATHGELTLLSLIGLIPHPVTLFSSALIMLIDAKKYEEEGDQKTANLMYIFAALGAYSGVMKIPGIKNLGVKVMSQIGEKVSKGWKLLPTESEVVKKVIENKDMIVQQLNKLKQSKVVQKTGEVATKVSDKYKNSKFSNSKVGKVTNTLAKPALTYGTIKATNSVIYDKYKQDKLTKYEDSVINDLAKGRK